MKNIYEITRETWFRERPWIVLGTGPSLDNFDYHKYKDSHNIAAIYSAADVCDRVDLHFAPDFIYMRDFGLPPEKRTLLAANRKPEQDRYIVTRSCNIAAQTENTIYLEYDCDIASYQNGVQLMPQYPAWPCSCTSSFIIMFFGTIGIKEILICGIDGGPGHAQKISQGYRDLSAFNKDDHDISNQGVFGWQKIYGIKFTKI